MWVRSLPIIVTITEKVWQSFSSGHKTVIPSPSPSIPHLKTVLCVAWLQLRWLSLGSHAFAVGISMCKAHRVGFWWDGCHSRGPAGPIYPSVWMGLILPPSGINAGMTRAEGAGGWQLGVQGGCLSLCFNSLVSLQIPSIDDWLLFVIPGFNKAKRILSHRTF